MEGFNERFQKEKAGIMASLEHERVVAEEKEAKPGDLVIPAHFGIEAPLKKSDEYLASAVSWVYACVNAIGENLASIEFRLNKMNAKGEVTEVENHPILDLLYRCNPVQTKFDFWYLAQGFLELTGECPIWVMRGANGRPVNLMLLQPDKFSPDGKADADSFVPYSGYKYRVDGKDVTFSLEEILFLKYPDFTRPYRGSGTLRAAAKTVDVDEFSEDYNRQFFYNSARPDALLSTEQTLTKKQKEDLKRMLKQMNGSKKNAHKQLVLDHGFSYTQLGMTRKDMDFLDQQKFSRDKIFSLFRVPKSIVAVSDDVNLASIKEHRAVFLEMVIKPKMRRITEQLNEFLLPMFPGTEGYFLDFEDPVPDDQDMKLKRYQNGLTLGWLVPNEVRADENLDSLGPDGDKPLRFGFQLPPSSSPTEQPKALPFKGKGMTADRVKHLNINKRKNRSAFMRLTSKKKEEQQITEQADKLVSAIEAKILPGIKKRLEKKNSDLAQAQKEKDEATETHAKHVKFWEDMVAKADDFEPSFKETILKLAHGSETNVLTNIENNLKRLTKKAVGDFLLDPENEAKSWVSVLLPHMNEITLIQGQAAMRLLGLDETLFKLHLERVQDFIAKRTFDFSFDVIQTTNEQLRKELVEGVGAGEGSADLGKRVKKVFEDFDTYRAERIARSEVILASNNATEEAYIQSEVVQGKEWLIAQDDRTCPICLAIYQDDQARVRSLGKSFFKRGDTIITTEGKVHTFNEPVKVPPAHPNCRCTIVPILR